MGMYVLLGLIAAALGAALIVTLSAYRRLRAEISRHRAEFAGHLNAKNAVIRDLESQRNLANSKLRASQEWSRVLKNASHDMIFVHRITADGLPGVIVEANELTCQTLGRPHDMLLGMTPLDFEVAHTAVGAPGYRTSELAAMSDTEIVKRARAVALRDARFVIRELLEKKHITFEREYEARDGRRIPVRVSAYLLEATDAPLVLCAAHDISPEQEARRAVRESEQRFHEFFEHSPVGVARYDAQRRLLNVNQACLKIFGVPDPPAFAKCNLFQGEFVPAEARTTLAKGETTRYETKIDFTEVRQKNLFITSAAGTVFVDVLVTNLGLDHEFRPRGYLALVQDITKRREAEEALRQSERQLAQAQKMQALGTLAGGIAHDFNNILTPILGYSEMLRDSLPPDGEQHEYVMEILKASRRARDLVSQILTFSRRKAHAAEMPPIHVAPIVKEVVKLQSATLPENIRVEVSIKTDRDIVAGDPTEMHQVLMNLITNAVYAMRDTGGLLDVQLTDFVITRKGRGEFPQLEPGRYLRLSVKDTGTGMDAATVEHIFEPFFTTKRGEGTGMGLAVVHGIVNAMKGAISVETAPGKGSTFHVVLPAVEQEAGAAPDRSGLAPSGTEKILFVDDDPEITKMAGLLLRSLGYSPTCVMSGEDALRVLQSNPNAFDLVITDMVMPGISGDELVNQIRSLRPDLPVLVCTGYSEVIQPEKLSTLGARGVLRKPLLRAELARSLRKVLNGKTQ